MFTKIQLLATLETPLSHFDPAVGNDSNSLTFNRQKQLVRVPESHAEYNNDELNKIALKIGYSKDIKEILSQLTPSEFIAVSIVRVFISAFSSVDGIGLMSGMDRYQMLHGRVKWSASRSKNILDFWNDLCDSMLTGIQHKDYDLLVIMIAKAARNNIAILDILRSKTTEIVSIARAWKQSHQKPTDKNDAADTLYGNIEKCEEEIEFKPEAFEGGLRAVEIPAYQGNALRQVTVRGPAFKSLMKRLGFDSRIPGDGELMPPVEAIFKNGGNLLAKSDSKPNKGEKKESSNQTYDGALIRKAFPSLNLLGGCTDSWDLGESKLRPSAHLVCKENAHFFGEFDHLDSARLSAMEMIDFVTFTRSAHKGLGQMIYNFETLGQGTQFLLNYTIYEDINNQELTDLTLGAFYDAILLWMKNPTLGGLSRAGLGRCEIEWLKKPHDVEDLAYKYRKYLEDNKEQLKDYMINGTLGASAKVITCAL